MDISIMATSSQGWRRWECPAGWLIESFIDGEFGFCGDCLEWPSLLSALLASGI